MVFSLEEHKWEKALLDATCELLGIVASDLRLWSDANGRKDWGHDGQIEGCRGVINK